MNFSVRIDNKQRAFADTILVAVHAVPARHVTLRFKVRQKGEMKLAIATAPDANKQFLEPLLQKLDAKTDINM